MFVFRLSRLTVLTIGFLSIFYLQCYSQHSAETSNRTVSFQSEDGVTIYADYIEVNLDRPIILLFHQGRSNARGEYSPIIPQLTERHFNVLAIDLRLGGDLYGYSNRTVNKNTSEEYEYCDAIADLEAAYRYAKELGYGSKVILWGSSYSGSLAIQLAARNPNDVLGVLAFSPSSGGTMQACQADIFFKDLKVPLFLLRPYKELEIPSVKMQWDSAQYYQHKTYQALSGTHGSSMLVENRVGADVAENWKVVYTFLEEIVESKK